MNFPNAPYQVFPNPIPPPPTTSLGRVCLEIDGKWIPYLLGCISQLAIERTWTSDQERATGEARNLLSLFAGAKECPNNVNFGIELEDCMGCCIRWNDDGILQVLSCGEWTDVPGPGSKVPITGIGGPTPTTPPEPGDCEQFIGKVLFFGRWLLPVPVSTGDVVHVTNALGATQDYIVDYPAYRCGDGTEFIFNGCLSGSEIFNGSDPAPAIHHGNLIAFDGTNYYDCGQAANSMDVEINILPGITDQPLQFLINSPGPGGTGDITFDVRYCRSAAVPITFSYIEGSGPAGVQQGSIATFSSQDTGFFQCNELHRIKVNFSPCKHTQLIALIGYTSFACQPDNVDYAYKDCAGVLQFCRVSDGCIDPPANWPNADAEYIELASRTPFQAQFRIG